MAKEKKKGADRGQEKKQAYFVKLIQLLEEYPKVLIVNADNVGSAQMQKIRILLRGEGVVLMGKNTMIRKAVRGHVAKNPKLQDLLPYVKGNIGFIFTKGNLKNIKDKVVALRVEAPARLGSFSPVDVIVPAGNTGLEPTQTSFLQALNIPSKINKGAVEILNDHLLLKKGDKVGASEATLLTKLNIKPFSYGLVPIAVYDDGTAYGPEILDISDEDILNKFLDGVKNIAALGLAISFPTTVAVPHVVVNAYRNLLAIAVQTDFSFKQAEKVKEFLKNPTAFAAAVTTPTPKPEKPAKDEPKAKPAAKPKPEEKKPDPEPDDDLEGGVGDLFGGF